MAERKTGRNVLDSEKRLQESRQLVIDYLDRLKVCRSGLIRDYGQPDDESVWPILLTKDYEEVRLADRGDTLVWLTGSRVVAEQFHPYDGQSPAGWRRVVDVDVANGDMVIGWSRGDHKMEYWSENAIEAASPTCNAPGVYAAQIAERIYSSRFVDKIIDPIS
jgi:hypothetical protein